MFTSGIAKHGYVCMAKNTSHFLCMQATKNMIVHYEISLDRDIMRASGALHPIALSHLCIVPLGMNRKCTHQSLF